MKRVQLIPALMVAAVCCVQAQTGLQNNGTLYVSGTGILHSTGSFTNSSAGALTNNGSLYVQQDLINDQAAMATGTGTLYLNGASAQSVSGLQVFKTFNLVTNNSAGITLGNDLSVSGTHTFTAGIIASSGTPNYLIYEAGSSYTGDGDAQHVSGWVRKNGTTNFVFPVGNNSVERAIGLTNLSVSAAFTAHYEGVTTNTGNKASPLVTVDPYEYWTVNKVSGGTAQVAMNWDKSKIMFPNYVLADIRVANYIASLWTSVGGSASGNVSTTGNITSSAVSSFGSFTFASVSVSLPVELLDFSAKRTAGYNLVTWSASDEINVKNYEVHRSDDGSSFYVIGTVPARNLPARQQYELTDNMPMGSVAYYRLRSVDIDGKFKWSDVVTVYDRTSPGNYFAVANPVHDVLDVSAGRLHNGDYDYRITAANGQVVQRGRLTIRNGGNYRVALSYALTQGVYIVAFRKDGFSYRRQVLVQ